MKRTPSSSIPEWRAEVWARLSRGEPVSDSAFDHIYPEHVRAVSDVHWTPVDVARQAVALLAPKPGTRVLDVGSGAGKLCFIGAAVTGATFVGIEQRQWLVELTNELAARAEIPRTRFLHGNALAADWS